MADTKTIQDLLERGLYHYGLGEVGKALQLWHEVLALEPKNEMAREYIEIETGQPAGQAAPVVDEAGFDLESGVIEDAPAGIGRESAGAEEFFTGQQMLLAERWQEAEQAFLTAHRLEPNNPLYWAHVELARARLVKDTIEKVGGLDKGPRLIPSMKELANLNFTQEEGFILSLINGEISFEDVIAISPVPRGITYRILHRLLADGLISIGEA